MAKTFLITGSTDGIGLETSKKLLKQGYHVLLHGRNSKKVKKLVAELSNFGLVEGYTTDLSNMSEVRNFSQKIK